MAAEKAPAFQFYPKDFLSDPNQMEMSLAEVGAYIRLIAYCWLESSIPGDLSRLARLVRATPAQMKKIWPAIGKCFRVDPTDPDRLIHLRLEKERAKQEEFRELQRGKGKASAAKRRAERQPSSNHGATDSGAMSPPTSNSPISDPQSPVANCQSPISQSRTGEHTVCTPTPTSGSPAAEVNTTHRNHAYCPPGGVGFCVPGFLDAEFRSMLGDHAHEIDLATWYSEMDRARVAEGVTVANPLQWWRDAMRLEMRGRGWVREREGGKPNGREHEGAARESVYQLS